jgi:hypothetical protein
MSGVKRRFGYEDAWLEKWGAAAVSTIAMTPTGFSMMQDLLLPSFWHGMLPVETRMVFAIIESEEGFTVDCLRKLHSECHVPLVDMHNIRVCF